VRERQDFQVASPLNCRIQHSALLSPAASDATDTNNHPFFSLDKQNLEIKIKFLSLTSTLLSHPLLACIFVSFWTAQQEGSWLKSQLGPWFKWCLTCNNAKGTFP